MTKPLHAIERAQARYGLTLVLADLQQCAADIQENKGTLIKVMPDKCSAWLVEVQGKLCKVIMSADLYRVITFLPFNAYCVLDAKGRPKRHRRSNVYVERKRDHRHQRNA